MIKRKNIFYSIINCLVFFLSLSISNAKDFNKNISPPSIEITKCKVNLDSINCSNYNINNDFKVTLLEEPYRILIDFEKPTKFSKDDLSNNLIKRVRYNQNKKTGTSLVLEMSEPGIITDITYEKNIREDLIDLNIKITKTTPAKYAVAKYIIKNNKGDLASLGTDIKISKPKKNISKQITLPSKKPLILKQNNSKKKYIVFIDPGHGGKDPGAIGQLGTLEKDITLKTSILLAKVLRKNGITKPILSRSKDTFLSLRQRTNLAKNNKADIFISIHADSSRNKRAKGLSVFSLSDKASDKEAEMLAKRENNSDKILGDNSIIKDPIIYGSLIKMFQREAMNESSSLARSIILNLEKTKLTLNRGHRFAGFAVLKSYDIPSILIEVGFLSNKQEEKKLLNKNYLDKLSKNLALAIENYFLTLN